MIISVFGPDGVGKSTVTSALSEHGAFVFSGTNVAAWPDTTWHNQLPAAGLDEPTINHEAHFAEKIQRAHSLARKLGAVHGVVVIDSDPLHKTMMHDYARNLPDATVAQRAIENRWRWFGRQVREPHDQWLHLSLQAGDDVTVDEQARILQGRIQRRGAPSHFDPRTTEESTRLIHACRSIDALLQDAGEQVVAVNTKEPPNIGALVKTLFALRVMPTAQSDTISA